MRISIVLCEGVHDIAFITKILIANGYEKFEKKIAEYPDPLNKIFKSNFLAESISDKKLGISSESFLIPSVSLIHEENLVLFHNMNGDSTTNQRYRVIDQYAKFTKYENEFIKEKISDVRFEFMFFYDADELEIDGRIKFIVDKFSYKFSIPKNDIVHGEKKNCGAYNVGCYIFHNNLTKRGTLEDHVLGLIKIENADILLKIESFLAENELDLNRTKEYEVLKDCCAGSSKFKILKSKIGIAGQLQFSGCNNSVIISKSDFIKKSDIIACLECNKIFKLFM